ncbi:MAG: hypothetical protein WKG01_17015 [Kofleriaceae bacterium]
MRCILVVASFVVLAAGCGDNSKQCGTGTTDVDGECLGMGGGNNCGEGTVEQNGTCVPAAEACEAGETAIEGNCVQVDATEGAEPNGTELGANPAGEILLAPGPDLFTVSGCMNNQPTAANDDPDFDRYQVTVTEPTLIKLTVDGRGGMVGGFYVVAADPDPTLATFERYGVSVASDMSRRQVYLPKAGVYDLVVSDTRTLIPRLEGEPMPAAGNPDGTSSCYLIHAETQTLPAATPLVAGTPVTGTIGEDVAVLTGAFANGFNSVTANINSAHARASLVVISNDQLLQVTGLVDGGTAVFGGVTSADQVTFVLDPIVNYGLAAAAYSVAVDFMMVSTPLPRDGATSTPQLSAGQEFGVLQDFNLFHWEVTESDTTDGMDLTFSIPMSGVIADRNLAILSPFASTNTAALNGGPTSDITETFTRYTGLVRTRAPGIYYLVLYAPRSAVGTPFTVKSTVTTLEETPVTFDVETAPQMPNAFNSNPFLYNAGEVPWQLWNARGTATGDLVTSFYDPAAAIGRLDTLAVRVGTGAGTPVNAESTAIPLVQHAFAQNGSRPLGRIVQDPVVPEDLTTLFVKVNPVRKTGGTRQFTLDFGPQTFHDFGDLASGSTSTVTDQPLTTANPQRRFFFEAPPNSTVTITVHPDTATLNPVLSLVDVDEQARIEVDDGIANQDETYSYTQPGAGFTAFVVAQALPVVTPQAFTVTVTIDPPTYALTSTATAFVDICATGVVLPAGGGIGDEGLTDPVPTVAGFDFFGAPAASQFIVSTNGFLSFDPGIADSNYRPNPLPDGIGETSIAPLWEDLWFVTICARTVGTRQTIQWTGEDFSNGDQVELQAILDASDDSIEFVWGPGTTAPGTSGASGIQALGGTFGFGVGAFSEFVVPGSSRKLTPAP